MKNIIDQKLLIIHSGKENKDLILKRICESVKHVYLVTTYPEAPFVRRFIGKKNVFYTPAYDVNSLLVSIEHFQNTRHMEFSGVMTYYEPMVYQTALVAQYYHLSGLRPNVALHTSCNKYLMRSECGKADIRMPKYCLVSSLEEGLVARTKFSGSIVIKPMNKAASEGVIKVEHPTDMDEFKTKYGYAVSCLIHDEDKRVLLEEYIPGNVISIDGVISHKSVVVAGMSSIDMGEEPYFFQKTCYIPGFLSNSEFHACIAFVKHVIAVLRMDNTAFHCEVRISNKRIYLLEIAARCPGGMLLEQYRYAYGMDIAFMAAQVALGQRVMRTNLHPRSYTAFPRISTVSSGTFVGCTGKEYMKGSMIKRVQWYVRCGDQLMQQKQPRAICGLLVRASTKNVCRRVVEQIYTNVLPQIMSPSKVSKHGVFMKAVMGVKTIFVKH